MKLIQLLLVSLALVAATTSCNTKPGEYSSMSAGLYHDVDLTIDTAWQKAFDTLSAKYTVTSDDHIQKEMTILVYEREVNLTMVALNEVTTRFEVSSRKNLFPQEAQARVVYNELKEALTQD